MTKELSKQLCELCGVELKEVDVTVCCHDCDKGCHGDCPEFLCPTETVKYYPDFGEPNNFVKLFNLVVEKDKTISSIVTTRTVYIENVEDFLQQLIYLFDTENPFVLKDIKQTIKNTEWRY